MAHNTYITSSLLFALKTTNTKWTGATFSAITHAHTFYFHTEVGHNGK